MSLLPGVIVPSRIVPSDSLDQYATHDAQFGRDGWRSVADLAERDAITDPRRKAGMVVHCQDDGKNYQLIGGITNSHWIELHTGGGISGPYVITVNGISGAVTVVEPDFMLADAQAMSGSLINYTNNVTAGLQAQISSISGSAGIHGIVDCSTVSHVVSVSHSVVDVTATVALVNLITPSSSDPIISLAVANRSATGFDCVLDSVPLVAGYKIEYLISSGGSGGGGSSGGVTSLNSLNGALNIFGVNGVGVSVSGNGIYIDVAAVSGAQGPQGIQGPAGPQGEQGPPGAIPEISGYTLLSTTSEISAYLQSQIDAISGGVVNLTSQDGSVTITAISGGYDLSATPASASAWLYGEVTLNSTTDEYTITHIDIDPTASIPVISLESEANFYKHRIFARDTTSFKVKLDATPVNGEKILWHLAAVRIEGGSYIVTEIGDFIVDESGNILAFA